MTPYRAPAPPRRLPVARRGRDTLGAIARAAIGFAVLAVWVRAVVVLWEMVGDVLSIVGGDITVAR